MHPRPCTPDQLFFFFFPSCSLSFSAFFHTSLVAVTHGYIDRPAVIVSSHIIGCAAESRGHPSSLRDREALPEKNNKVQAWQDFFFRLTHQRCAPSAPPPQHRPKKNAPVGSKGAALKQHIHATLGSGNLREAVLLPPGEDLNEWLAVNTVDFYNAISMLYATLGRERNESHLSYYAYRVVLFFFNLLYIPYL